MTPTPTPTPTPTMLDWVVVGSGFGGSVAALRLAEKGYDVTVLEQGRRFEDDDFARNAWDAGRYWWAPALGLRGILKLTPFRHVTVLSGVGVGGGSLVYGNTLYVPHSDDFYRHEQWRDLADWRAELAPHFANAQRMLGVVPYSPADGHSSPSDRLMHAVAAEMGIADSVHPTQVGVFLGTPGVRVPDPYFAGDGPERSGCVRCGQCMLGCRHGAKNTLVKNYLHLAERRGVTIAPDRVVVDIRPLGAANGSDGYAVTSERSGRWLRPDRQTIHTRGVVLAAGPLGTNQLLRRLKDSGSLPAVSDRLGDLVRTNSEAVVAVTAGERHADLRSDLAITSSAHPDEATHFTNNTFGDGGNGFAVSFGPWNSRESRPLRAVLWLLMALLRHPLRWLSPLRTRGWSRRTIIFTIMQSSDNALRFRAGRRGRINTDLGDGVQPATKLPIADEILAATTRLTGGYAQAGITESVTGKPTTAHLLGGAVIGADPSRGVVDRDRRLFGYERFLVVDGSTLPANVGVNPSLTITAMAEHALEKVQARA